MSQYNWDNLEVGRHDLNHSENFFAFKHSQHEKFCFGSEIEAMIDEEDVKKHCEVLNEQFLQDPLNFEIDSEGTLCKKIIQPQEYKSDKHNMEKSTKCSFQNNSKETYSKNATVRKSKSPIIIKSDKENSNKVLSKTSEVIELQYYEEIVQTKDLSENLDKAPLQVLETDKKYIRNVKLLNSHVPKSNPPSNLLQQPLRVLSNVQIQNKEKGPNVLKYVDIYERKRQNVIKRQLEDDRKNRIFHSKPAPNFNAARETALKRYVEKKITQPVTPRVLKHPAKIIDKVKKFKSLEKRSPKKYAKDAKVLSESPFVPKKESRTLDSQPFNLHVEKRLCERKYFDEKIQKQMEEKKKREEEERVKRDEELSKEFRKMTTFKARPNPFK